MSRTNRSILSTISGIVGNLFRSNKRTNRNRNKDTIFSPSPRTLKTFYKTAEDTKKEILSKGRLKLNESVIDGGKNKSRKQRKTKRNYKNQ